MYWFLESYLAKRGLSSESAALFDPAASLPDLMAAIGQERISKGRKLERYSHITEFLDWVIITGFSQPNDHGVPVPQIANPFPHIRWRDVRHRDSTCQWFTVRYGAKWEAWRSYTERWLRERGGQGQRHANRTRSINWFLESYLVQGGLSPEPASLFDPEASLPDLMTAIKQEVKSKNSATQQGNRIKQALEFREYVGGIRRSIRPVSAGS